MPNQVQLSSDVRAAGNVLLNDRSVLWTSDNTAIATVDQTGLVTATGIGTTTIRATCEGIQDLLTVTVTRAVATVNLTPAPTFQLTDGAFIDLIAVLLGSDGVPLVGRTATANTNNANVTAVPQGVSNASGQVTVRVTDVAASAGVTFTVQATSEGVTSNIVTGTIVMATAAVDEFARADNAATLGFAPTGQEWQYLSLGGSTLGIESNRARYTGAGNRVFGYINTSSPNGTITMGPMTTSDKDVGIAFRIVDENNLWAFFEDAGYKLYEKVAGVFTLRAESYRTRQVNDVLTVEMDGNDIICRVNDWICFTQSSASYNTSVKHGMTISSAAPRIERWEFQPTFTGLMAKYTVGDSLAAKGVYYARATPATYEDSAGVIQTASSGVARDNHYIGGERVLLIESQVRTNYLVDSENGGSVSGGSTVTRNVVTAPDGATTADIVESMGPGRQLEWTSSPGGGHSAVSVYVKLPAGSTFGEIRMEGYIDNGRYAVTVFNIATGVIVSSSADAARPVIYQLGTTGWWRIGQSKDAVGAYTSFKIQSTNAAAVGNSMYFWGAQMEGGSSVSSYIKTTTASVIRNGDDLFFPWTVKGRATTYYNDLRANGMAFNGIDVVSLTDVGSGEYGAVNTLERVATIVAVDSPRHIKFFAKKPDGTSTEAQFHMTSPDPVYGDRVETRNVMRATASFVGQGAIASRAEVSNEQLVGPMFTGNDYVLSRYHVGHNYAGTGRGGFGVKKLVVMSGEKSLATVRAA